MAMDKYKVVMIAVAAVVVVTIGVSLMVAFLVDWDGPAPPDSQPTFGGFTGPKVRREASGKIADEWLVVMDPEATNTMDEVEEELDSMDMPWSIGAKHNGLGIMTMHCPEDVLDEAVAMDRMQRNTLYVEPDQTINLTQTASYGLDRIDQRNLPLDNSFSPVQTGQGVHVYVIDTGIRLTHNEFGGRAVSGFSAFQNPEDCNGHGTHVAGTIGGQNFGVAKGASLHAVKVLNCDGSGTMSGVIAGMDWTAQNRQLPAIASMSLGGGANSASDSAVSRLKAAGVTVVVAAGNDNSNACNYSPARAGDAITVGSTTSTDSRSGFSNYGNCVNIFAPGSSIPSAYYRSDSDQATLSGTSMACPHVSGVAALYLQTNPGATPDQVASFIDEYSTKNEVNNAGPGSPNKLLYYPEGGLSGGATTGSATTGGGSSTSGGGNPGGGDIGSDLTQEEMNEILSLHNSARRQVCVMDAQWDSRLATVAQNWADGCNFAHNNDRSTDYQAVGGSGYVGENIAMGTASFYGVGALTQLWIDEKDDPGWQCGQQFGSGTGHYTQIVWADSTKVGCGAAICGGNRYVVCNYAPGGNIFGQDPFPPSQEACSFSCTSDSTSGGTPVPTEAPPSCEQCGTEEGSLSRRGQMNVHGPGDTYYVRTSSQGTIKGSLKGAPGTDFDLYLYKYLGNGWAVSTRSITPSSDESFEYSAEPGIYTWGVVSYYGSGSYTVTMEAPN